MKSRQVYDARPVSRDFIPAYMSVGAAMKGVTRIPAA
jgi:hypothetical protein